jgi:hypothetical protein
MGAEATPVSYHRRQDSLCHGLVFVTVSSRRPEPDGRDAPAAAGPTAALNIGAAASRSGLNRRARPESGEGMKMLKYHLENLTSSTVAFAGDIEIANPDQKNRGPWT